MSKPGEVVLSATERMLVEKQKAEIRRMRMSKEQLELFRLNLILCSETSEQKVTETPS